jgi:hypothetical protein
VTLTEGAFIGSDADAPEQVIADWVAISDRSGEIVPDYGFTQAEREVASASSASGSVVAVAGRR